MSQFDIAIVGGAMAGACLALALAAQRKDDGSRWNIALIEAFPSVDPAHPGFDSRAIALAHGSVQRLTELGIWSDLNTHAQAIEQIEVSDQGHFGGVRLDAEAYQVDALGQVVELERVGPVLWQALSRCDNIQLYCPDSLAQLKQTQDQVELTLASNTVLSAKLVVGADGTHSLVRQQIKLGLKRQPYDQQALIANICADDHTSTAFERFTAQGPLALLPMTQDRYSLVWVQHPEQASRRMALSETAFLSELQQAFGYRLGTLRQVGQRAHYPLALCQAERTFAHRCVLVGNAAQTVHPIAGQGFNLGLRDVITLADQLAVALAQSDDPGCYRVLAHYQQLRQADRQHTTCATNTLVKLFSNDSRPLALGRNIGLLALALSPNLKSILARRAMGQHGSHSATTA